ncbi:MAG: GGDEF domain-containing protein [Vampirovibrio sp.]|nr:GGDEF domain-containing protein [Vampirovibrio sp.]
MVNKQTLKKQKLRSKPDLTQLALNTVVARSGQSGAAILELANKSLDLTQQEIQCARQFNFEMPEDISLAVDLLERSIQNITATEKNVILVFDETSGTYHCLNDVKNPGSKPREFTQISDRFLQDLLDSEEVIHTYLYAYGAPLGIVAIAERMDGKPLSVTDDILLELASRYLATKVIAFLTMKQSISLSFIQNTMLDVASQLVTAVDQETIFRHTLEFLNSKLGFGMAQYVALDETTGEGEVLVKCVDGQIESYTHAGLESKRDRVKEFASLVSLFSSVARTQPYLHITGKNLGDKSLADVFQLTQDLEKDAIQSALILPVPDAATGMIKGTINLFQADDNVISEEALEVARETMGLVSLALSRAKVLEKALAMASSDELTGLTNRRGFYNRFEAEIERARRKPTPICVVMMDVDFFKKLNDTYGHLNGDLVLKHLSAMYVQNVRKSDLVCRFGGEEFTILLPDTELDAARELMDRIREKISETVVTGVNGEKIHVTISAGVAQVDAGQLTGSKRKTMEVISNALALADKQLYVAKEEGRNQVCAAC